jgi:hypothetical protein
MTIKALIPSAFLCVLLIACMTTKVPTNSTKVPAKFDFTPPSRTQAGATGMTIALIRPTFIGQNPEYFVEPFNEMASNMANDFEELLSAKGFNIRSVRSRDEMVYNDKLNCSFALEVQIDLRPEYNRKYKYDVGLGVLIPSSYRLSGEVTLGGNLVLTASSPQYGEKIWKKNIALDKTLFTYTGSTKWVTVPTVAEELKQDNEFYNALSRHLEKYYNQALQLAWSQIVADEMKGITAEAKKADKRGG